MPTNHQKGWGVAIIVNALDGSTALNPQGFAITVNGRMRNTEIASTETTYIDAWSTLPDWSIFDYLTSLAFTNNKRFSLTSPTKICYKPFRWKKLQQIRQKLVGKKVDLIALNIFTVWRFSADKRNSIRKRRNAFGRDKQYFFHTTIPKIRHLMQKRVLFQNSDTPRWWIFFHPYRTANKIPIPFFFDKEPVPGLVTTAVIWFGLKDDTQQYWSAAETTYLTDKDDDYLTYTLRTLTKLKPNSILNVIDLFNIDFTHPIF